jgi:branched-chain amino acid transport system ATP-binding protein
MASPVLGVREVSLRFGELWALRDVSIDVPQGRTIGLIGPNGAGKSTLLNVIAGRQAPSSGRITFAGRDVTHDDAATRARHGIRRTFQDQALFTEMTVLDNLLVASATARAGGSGAGQARASSRARRDHVSQLVRSLDLEACLYREVQTLPHPVQRLVAYARAVAGEPTLLLLDEPAAGLSDAARGLLADQLRRDISSRELSVVLVEHDMGFIRELCSEAYVLNAGSVMAFGSFEEIAASDVVKAAYLGES